MLTEPETITIAGTDYKINGFTQDVQSKYEKYLQKWHLDLLLEDRDKLGDDYLLMRKQHMVDVKRGKLSFFSNAFWDFIKSDNDNLTQLLWFCIMSVNPISKDILSKWVDEQETEAVLLFNKLAEDCVDASKKK